MLQKYLTRDDTPLPDGDNRRPPPNAGEMIFNHLLLVRKYARRRASTVYDEKGWQALDDSLFSDLENVGMEALEAAVHRFDPTRGVTFGAFVRQRVAGAMDDWLNHKRIRYATDGYAARAMEGKWATSDAPKRHRTSTGAYRERVYTEMAVQPRGAARLIPAHRLSFDQTMEAALEKLNPRQREVYRGRVLSDPPIPRAVLAATLGIRDEVQIPRIEKQARKKMARFLKVSPP
jgi:RNA polymerase sigma factor (sigma-70 family)